MDTVLHLIRAADFARTARGPVVVACPPGGFIHCTADAELLLHVANLAFRQDPDEFLVLVLDTSQLSAELRWEPPDPPPPAGSPLAAQRFPHLYGPLNLEAIVEVRDVSRAPDGTFLST
jgi:uncharacterized protein (DUF952 family)